jgi:pyruvate formate lyase activating enzyme
MFDVLTVVSPQAPTDAKTLTGTVHSVETGGAVDGPGVRFVYFMSGCQFRCLYCHNPDTWGLHNGHVMTLDEALAEGKSYAAFLRIAGGVTISGGEPMTQAAFVGALLGRIKSELGLHTALDTQGFLHTHVADDWFDPVDLVLLDIKHIDPERYHAITGQALQPTLDCARRLVRLNKRMWVRYVLVPGLTDAPGDIGALANFVVSLGPLVERVEVLPFHQMGASKWQELGIEYKLAGCPTPTAEQTERARALFAAHGLVVS